MGTRRFVAAVVRLPYAGRGTAPPDDRAVFMAVVYVLAGGCAWRNLPVTFGVWPATAHRQFTALIGAELWSRLHRAVQDKPGARGGLYWPPL
ncbi:transposase [Streptomyces tremellae]|uniref:transposase n=1 Tax=Streptomyces tremellae TaxID=1124239 RepID=UPI003CD0ABC9